MNTAVERNALLCGEINLCVVKSIFVWWNQSLCGEINLCVVKSIFVWILTIAYMCCPCVCLYMVWYRYIPMFTCLLSDDVSWMWALFRYTEIMRTDMLHMQTQTVWWHKHDSCPHTRSATAHVAHAVHTNMSALRTPAVPPGLLSTWAHVKCMPAHDFCNDSPSCTFANRFVARDREAYRLSRTWSFSRWWTIFDLEETSHEDILMCRMSSFAWILIVYYVFTYCIVSIHHWLILWTEHSYVLKECTAAYARRTIVLSCRGMRGEP
jgi:hypothetical protein